MIGAAVALILLTAAPQPPLSVVLDGAAKAWPEQPAKARAVAVCEMGADIITGTYASAVFDLDRPYGGPMQIGRSWRGYFASRWTWGRDRYGARRTFRGGAGNIRPRGRLVAMAVLRAVKLTSLGIDP